MFRSDYNEFVNQLIALTGGRLQKHSDYGTLKAAFEMYREDGRFYSGDEEQSSLFGLTLAMYRQHLKRFWGRADADTFSTDRFMAISFNDWYMCIEREVWQMLLLEKTPSQFVANVLADCALFYHDNAFLMGQVQTILEQMRTLWNPTLLPLEPTGCPNNETTRRLYTLLKVSTRADEFIQRLMQYRIEQIEKSVEPNLSNEERAKLIAQTERMQALNLVNRYE